MENFKAVQKPIKEGPVFFSEAFKDHEQVVFCSDSETGLKAIIGIHDTTLGPALGGTRMWNYASEREAIRDVLRLSRGMTYKAAITGLNLGGGKAVIIGDSRKDKSDALMQKFGEYVNSLSGRYITAEDVGINPHDMEMVHTKTKHVTGLPEAKGGSGDPSPVTAYGVFMGMKAAAKFKYGSDSLEGKKVVVQGIGHVGETLVKHLTEAGALVTIHDLHEDTMERVALTYNAQVYRGTNLYAEPMDIYAPCALGATINDESLAVLNCDIIAGAANNQLANEAQHGEAVQRKGILYAPDFLINAGGLINVYSEIVNYTRDESLRKTEEIYNTALEIFKTSEIEGITTHQAALKIAVQRIKTAKKP